MTARPLLDVLAEHVATITATRKAPPMTSTPAPFSFTHATTLARWVNLEGQRVTAASLAALLERHGDKITTATGAHAEQPTATLVAETFALNGEPWEWAYVGDDRLKLEAAVATWLLIEDNLEECVPTTLKITTP